MLLINLPENRLLEERSRGCGRRGTQQIPSVDVTLSYSCQWTEEFRMDGGVGGRQRARQKAPSSSSRDFFAVFGCTSRHVCEHVAAGKMQ